MGGPSDITSRWSYSAHAAVVGIFSSRHKVRFGTSWAMVRHVLSNIELSHVSIVSGTLGQDTSVRRWGENDTIFSFLDACLIPQPWRRIVQNWKQWGRVSSLQKHVFELGCSCCVVFLFFVSECFPSLCFGFYPPVGSIWHNTSSVPIKLETKSDNSFFCL